MICDILVTYLDGVYLETDYILMWIELFILELRAVDVDLWSPSDPNVA